MTEEELQTALKCLAVLMPRDEVIRNMVVVAAALLEKDAPDFLRQAADAIEDQLAAVVH